MIKLIKLTNIRRFADATFEFDEGTNLILGANGSGKTTILEAAGFFSFGKILSVPGDFLAVSQGEQVGRIEIVTMRNGERREAEAAILAGQKILKVLQNKVPASQIIGFVKMVYFNPETIDLVSGAPHVRRRELDLAIAQKKPVFVRTLLHYRNILKQRNNLLKRIAQGEARSDEVGFWDGELVEYGRKIVAQRAELIDVINSDIAGVFSRLSGKKGDLKLKMLLSCDYEKFAEVLGGNLESDVRTGLTNFGPHRDDFIFQLKSVGRQSSVVGRGSSFAGAGNQTTNDKRQTFSMREQASRGEQRLAAVAFKVEAKKFLTDGEEHGSTRFADRGGPVIVFDDVFSELDESRREAVAEIASGGQVIISATDARVVPEILKKKAKVIKLN